MSVQAARIKDVVSRKRKQSRKGRAERTDMLQPRTFSGVLLFGFRGSAFDLALRAESPRLSRVLIRTNVIFSTPVSVWHQEKHADPEELRGEAGNLDLLGEFLNSAT